MSHLHVETEMSIFILHLFVFVTKPTIIDVGLSSQHALAIYGFLEVLRKETRCVVHLTKVTHHQTIYDS